MLPLAQPSHNPSCKRMWDLQSVGPVNDDLSCLVSLTVSNLFIMRHGVAQACRAVAGVGPEPVCL